MHSCANSTDWGGLQVALNSYSDVTWHVCAAGAATGAVAALAATVAAAGTIATSATSSLLKRAASDTVLDSDASATCIVALGKLAATYSMRFRHSDSHAAHALQQAFALAVHLLDEAIPEVNEAIAEPSMKLPEGWDATIDDDISAVLAAVPKPQSGAAAPFSAAAINILADLLEASEHSEACQLAFIIAGVLRVSAPLLSDAESGSAVYGACMASVHSAPKVLQVLQNVAAASEAESEQCLAAARELVIMVKFALAKPVDGCAFACMYTCSLRQIYMPPEYISTLMMHGHRCL